MTPLSQSPKPCCMVSVSVWKLQSCQFDLVMPRVRSFGHEEREIVRSEMQKVEEPDEMSP
jgi:hypothetical protein